MFLVHNMAKMSTNTEGKNKHLSINIHWQYLYRRADTLGKETTDTVFPRSRDPFYIVSYYIKTIKTIKTSWTDSM